VFVDHNDAALATKKTQSRMEATHLTRFPFSSVFSLGAALRRPLWEEEAAEGEP
jgi:hypothetical protein